MIYDYIIVGAGISGLYSAYKLLQKNSKLNILILESQSRIGGRCETISFKDNDGTQIQYEAGGARFSNKHTRLVKLLKELDLYNDKVKISNTIDFITTPKELYKEYREEFKSLDDIMLKVNKIIKKDNISDSILRNTTLCKLTETHLNKHFPVSKYKVSFSKFLIDYFEYWSEFSTLNALDALSLFTDEFNQKIQYYILKNGYSSIIDTLVNKCNKYKNFKLQTLSYVTKITKTFNTYKISKNINSLSTNEYTITYTNVKSKSFNNVAVKCKNIILALPIMSLFNISFLTDTNIKTIQNTKNITNVFELKNKKLEKLLNNNIQNATLYRIYARYPNYYHEIDNDGNKVRVNKAWFHDINKVNCNLALKYIIPVNTDTGLIMISYTDGKKANKLVRKFTGYSSQSNIDSEEEFGYLVADNLKKLFPNKIIPKPKWFKHHNWYLGAAYWKPSTLYTKYKQQPKHLSQWLSKYFINYMNDKTLLNKKTNSASKSGNLFLVGENISTHQAWVEGALQTVDLCMDNIGNINVKDITIHKSITKKKTLTYIKKTITKQKHKNTSRTKKVKKSKTKVGGKPTIYYTITEVAKHNKKTDAWMIINNKVYNITEWIPNHPGGNIILKGIGKDATYLFENLHKHGVYANKILKKYYIGKLKQ